MTLQEFAQLVPGLSGLAHVEKIKHFGWYLHTQESMERFATGDIRRCYESLHYFLPGNLTQLIQQLAEKSPPGLLRNSNDYRLEGRAREVYDAKYANRPATIAVDVMLQALPGKVTDEAERLFLTEAVNCFRVKAFRATIVMTWNVAYDHLLNWIVVNHLTAFNAAIIRKFPKRVGVVMAKKDDFGDEFKEHEVIEICGTAGLFVGNIKKILNEKLTKRNLAAHPSLIEITQYQAEDVITDLVSNVILKLA